MLVLTRQLNEEIVIGGNIILSIVSIQRDRVRIGIQAPDNLRIDRKEVYLRRLEEQEQVSLGEPASSGVDTVVIPLCDEQPICESLRDSE